jgi:MFS family permease
MLAGQLLGTAFGLLVIGNVAAVSWRLALWVLALPSIALAWALWRALPEPARGGASRLRRGGRKLKAAPQPATTKSGRPTRSRDADAQSSRSAAKMRDSTVARAVAQTRAKPHRKLVLDCDPRRMSVWEAARYVLRLRTNVLLIVSSVSTRAT